ncbi:MAG: hypothetical protein ACXABI_16230, partial [Candidatus Hodarchaeales archaeon]
NQIADRELVIDVPSELNLDADLVFTEINGGTQKAWFFSSEIKSTASILMFPNWIGTKSSENSLKTARILQVMGFNVLLPIIHDIDESTKILLKKHFSHKNYKSTMEAWYDYLLSLKSLDRKQIAIYSEYLGTVFASLFVKTQPIKAIVLENGPVSLSRVFVQKLTLTGILGRILSFLITRILNVFLWKTFWDPQKALSILHSCPSFQLSVADHDEMPNHQIFRNFENTYKPKQLWFENALLPVGGIRDTWPEEFKWQVNQFFSCWINKLQSLDWHYDIGTEKRRNIYHTQLKISVLPPQLEEIPLQITIFGKKSQYTQKRVLFLGAEMIIELDLPYHPNYASALPLQNVEASGSGIHPWVKLGGQRAIRRNLDAIVNLDYTNLVRNEKRYFMIKQAIFQELES